MNSVVKIRRRSHIGIPRERILAFERAMRGLPVENVLGSEDFVTRHHFAEGSYGREIELPAGTIVVGKIHRHSHVNVVSKGRCLVATEDGVIEISAPYTFVSQPGTKRIVCAVEDTIWTTVHVSNETDLAKLEDEIIAPSYEELECKGSES
jgi:quercetin dioxygenase-like cupin family protein